MIYFTSDTHFHHKNIIKYCDRPFNDVYFMNRTLVNNWNKKVNESDTVYHLGDVGFSSNTHDTVKKLNGKKVLIMGNHDYNLSREKLENCFDVVYENTVDLAITHKDSGPTHNYHGFGLECVSANMEDHYYLNIPMVHDPRERENHRFTIVGHVHDNFKFLSNRLNVGVDVWGFEPVEISKILKYYKTNKEQREYCRDKRGFYDEWAKIESLQRDLSKIKNLVGEIDDVF